MNEHSPDPEQEVRRLRRCMLDLVSVLALPAAWNSSEPERILGTFLDALLYMLDLDFLYGTMRLDSGSVPIEVLRLARHLAINLSSEEIRQTLNQWFGRDPNQWPKQRRRHIGDREISISPLPLGIGGDLGLLVAGTRRASFPEDTERLILCVAANQAAIGLQYALRLNEQKRVAGELDRRVAERTRELAETNEELQLQVELLQRIPVAAWTLKPDGTPDFVNQVSLEYSGQTLPFVRSHPEAWMAAVHPEDRERVLRSFWEGVRSGQGFAMEGRVLRVHDGVWRWHLHRAVVLRDAEGKVLKFVGTSTDIDDQKRAEEALRASESNLRRVIDTIPTLSWCNLADGPNEFLSKSWHQYTGLSPEEAHGWGWSVAFHPDDLPPLMKRWQELLVSGEPGEIEARLRRHDGVYRWFLIRVSPFRDETGTIIRWYGTSTDIEDRKRAQDAVVANERNLGLIINTMPILAWSARADGNVDFVNQRWLDYTGLSAEQALGWGWAQAFHPDDLSRLSDYWLSIIGAGEPGEIEARLRRFDGSYRWFLFRASPLRDESGTVVRWYGTNSDIEDRKQSEEALRESEQSFRLIVDGIAGLVAITSPTGEVEGFNRQALTYFGKTVEELKGWATSDVVHPEDLPAVVTAWMRSIETTSDYDVDHRLLRADGEYRWFHARGLPLRDAEGRVVLWYVLLTDIDDRKRAEEALTRARAELAHVARVTSLGVLTASIAHEVNQPLSGILTNAGTCLRMLNSEPPNIDGARETARRTIRDANRASDVITRLRALFRKKEATADPVDLNEAAREVIALLLSELQTNRVVLKDELADDLPLVRGDRIQLQQVILNLLRNASEAMSTVDGRPRQLLLKTESHDGDQVRLTVRDSGVGFDPVIADQLFESFYTTKDDGMGIGLSVSRSIIEAHQGRLWAARNDGPGATFAFTLPGIEGGTK
jgi:PAS domain S-box-containing protein